jgi:hypothetical protein
VLLKPYRGTPQPVPPTHDGRLQSASERVLTPERPTLPGCLACFGAVAWHGLRQRYLGTAAELQGGLPRRPARG